MKKMNNTCISHLLIPESDQIQIVVSRVGSDRGKTGATDITVTTMKRNQVGFIDGNRNRLPPLFISNTIGTFPSEDLSRRVLRPSPSSPAKSRIPSPRGRRSSASSTGQSGYGSRGSLVSSSVSVPASPTTAPSSKYHQGCIVPPSASYPSGFPQIVNTGSAGALNGGVMPAAGAMNKFISDSVGNEVSSSATSSAASTIRRLPRNSRSRSRSPSRNSSPLRSNGSYSGRDTLSNINSNGDGMALKDAPVILLSP